MYSTTKSVTSDVIMSPNVKSEKHVTIGSFCNLVKHINKLQCGRCET